ncbi:uncharacterized protein LOC143045198 isoform X1 [Mytilus galloprovincialis]|uniref:uncharacterized protein LOC143045198 isoform X1 n=1 Tax=Mytilus galloprovincialis TaxID=29158 RepID=UPI003F7BD97F
MDLFPRFVGILMLFVLYIAVGVKGVTFDAACNGTGVGNCSDSNTICDAKSHKCACSTTSYKTNATTCVKKIALNGSCSNTPTDQCADSNAVCDATKHTCGCKSTHFVNTTGACQLRVAFDAGCKGTGVGDCTDSNNICDTNSHKCACSTTSYKKNATTCATKIALAGACTASPAGQCADPQAECNATKHTCGCKSTHFVNKTGACHQKVAFNATCVVAEPAKDQCVANTECKNAGVTGTYQCLCKATHYESAGSCEPRKSPKVNCASGECVSHASCDSGTNKCVCDAGYDPSPTISPTMCNGVVKVFTLSYMYVVPILVSLNFLLR